MDNQKRIQLIQECPMCGARYDQMSTFVVRESESGHLLYLKCAQCLGGVVATVVEAPFGLLGSGLVTDLQYDEVEKFFSSAPVTEDDVLTVHSILSQADKK